MRILHLILAIYFFACSKADETAPTIDITSPEQNQLFAGGEVVKVKSVITDNAGIHKVHTIVTDNSGGHWVHSEDHTDSKNCEVVKTFTAISGRTYTIHIDATDHNQKHCAEGNNGFCQLITASYRSTFDSKAFSLTVIFALCE